MNAIQKIPALLFLLLSLFANGQEKDSLAKYSLDELLEKQNKAKYLTKSILHFYCKEILRRNPVDSIKFLAYTSLGFYERDATGNNINAISYYKKALKFNTSIVNRQYALVVLGELYALNNEYEKALQCIEEVKKNAPKHFTINYDVIYFLMGDFKKSVALNLKYLKESEQYDGSHPNQTDEQRDEMKSIKCGSYSSLIIYYNYLHQPDSATYYLKKFKEEEQDFYNQYFDGLWYHETFTLILKGQYDKAIARMEKSKNYINSSETERYCANYYYAVCFQKKMDYKKSMDYAEAGLKHIVTLISFQNYELELYKIASENAKNLGLTTKENFYLKKYNEGAQKINYQGKAAFMAKLYEQDIIDPLNDELHSKEKKTFYLWSGLVLIFVLSGSYVSYSLYKSKKERKHFNAIIANLEIQKASYKTAKPKETAEEMLDCQIKKSITISDETEKKILKSLERFEKNLQFLSPDISLVSIAQEFKTNVYYITYVVKKHKSNNFNGYINKLRIDYIIQKLKFDPAYINYTIDYLAKESGFASYGTFKRIFAKEVGIDPSKFIKYLKENEDFTSTSSFG